MTYLLDVNVLIALIDPNHVDHGRAHGWAATSTPAGWATCPIVENGVIRILGHSGDPMRATAGSPANVAKLLGDLRGTPGHVFWSDDISLFDAKLVDLDAILNSRQVTDSYLLALALRHGGKLATFDRRLATNAVFGGEHALHLIS